MTTPSHALRLCDVCGLQDDHPRHVRSVPPDFPGAVPTTQFLRSLAAGADPVAVAELLDPSTVVRHMDCCANNGCPDNCMKIWTDSGKASGQALRDYILTLGA